jgi:hypothetical protein
MCDLSGECHCAERQRDHATVRAARVGLPTWAVVVVVALAALAPWLAYDSKVAAVAA